MRSILVFVAGLNCGRDARLKEIWG